MLSRTAGSLAGRCGPPLFHTPRHAPASSSRHVVVAHRALSTKDVFGVHTTPVDATSPLAFTIPEAPAPPPFRKSLVEMYQDHESLLDELGLFQWWKPTGYLRYVIEFLHLHGGLEWWAAISASRSTRRRPSLTCRGGDSPRPLLTFSDDRPPTSDHMGAGNLPADTGANEPALCGVEAVPRPNGRRETRGEQAAE